MFSIGWYFKIALMLFILIGGISAGWFVKRAIDNYNNTIAEQATLLKERDDLQASIKRMQGQIEAAKDRAANQDRLAIERELLLGQLNIDSKRKEVIIEENRNEECVMHPVPPPVVDGLLSYAKAKNSDRDKGSGY